MSGRLLRVRANANFKRYLRGDELLLVEDAEILAEIKSSYWEVLAIETPAITVVDAAVDDIPEPDAVVRPPRARKATAKGKGRGKVARSV